MPAELDSGESPSPGLQRTAFHSAPMAFPLGMSKERETDTETQREEREEEGERRKARERPGGKGRRGRERSHFLFLESHQCCQMRTPPSHIGGWGFKCMNCGEGEEHTIQSLAVTATWFYCYCKVIPVQFPPGD